MYIPTIEEIEQEKNKRLYKASYYDFLKKAVEVLEPQTDWKFNWHIEYLCEELQKETHRIGQKKKKEKDLVINIPPRSLKSRIVTICWNAWSWIHYPHLKFITASYSASLATEHALETRNLIQSEWYQDLFGDIFQLSSDQNVKTKFSNDKGGQRIATSVGSSVTGSGADIIIADDPLKLNPTELELQTAQKWWFKSMFSRINNQDIGLRLVVMQRVDEADLTGVINFKKGSYKHICLPVSENNNIKPAKLKQNYKNGLLFPVRFSLEFLENAKETLGILEYAGQYLQSPAPSGGSVFKKEWLNQKFNSIEIKATRHFKSDTAYGKEHSDNSATLCYAIENNNLYLFNFWKANLTFPKFIKAYPQFVLQNGYSKESKCYFEPKATGISTVQQLRDTTSLNVVEDKSPRDSKETRAKSVSAKVESGRVFFAEGVNWDDFIQELLIFPNGKNDDMVDTFVMALLELDKKKKIKIKRVGGWS